MLIKNYCEPDSNMIRQEQRLDTKLNDLFYILTLKSLVSLKSEVKFVWLTVAFVNIINSHIISSFYFRKKV